MPCWPIALSVTSTKGITFCPRLWDSLATNAYGIYLLHYPVVTWAQYGLLTAPLHAAIKAALVFGSALTLSWAGTIVLRRLPGIARII